MVSYIVTERRLSVSDYARILQRKEVIYPKDALVELKCDFGNEDDNKFMYRIETACEPHLFMEAYHIDGSVVFENTNGNWNCYMACKREWFQMLSDMKDTIFDDLEARRVQHDYENW